MEILATHRALFGRRGRSEGTRTMSATDVARVVRVFEATRARWALVGGHAIGMLTEPRATADFDFIIEGAKFDDVMGALTKEFGQLDGNDIGAAIQLRAIDVDLIRSTNHPLFQRALEHVRTIGKWKLPRTEVVLVLRFLAAVSAWRARHKRMQDVSDISSMYAVAGEELDRALMLELAALAYPGAEREFSELLAKIDRGDPISI
jgi:hypothetical protein